YNPQDPRLKARDSHLAATEPWRRQQQPEPQPQPQTQTQPPPAPRSVPQPPSPVENQSAPAPAPQLQAPALAPRPQAPGRRARHAGGCPPTHSWKVIAQQIDRRVEGDGRRRRPLPLNEKGEPSRVHAVNLMIELFKQYERSSPTKTSIYRWLRENWPTCQNWWQN